MLEAVLQTQATTTNTTATPTIGNDSCNEFAHEITVALATTVQAEQTAQQEQEQVLLFQLCAPVTQPISPPPPRRPDKSASDLSLTTATTTTVPSSLIYL